MVIHRKCLRQYNGGEAILNRFPADNGYDSYAGDIFSDNPLSGRWLVLEVVDDGGDHADVLHVGFAGVEVFDGELTLAGSFDFAENGFAVFGELGGGFASVLGGFGYHLGFDFIEAVEGVVDIGVRDRYAACQQCALLVDHGVDVIDLGGVDVDRAGKGVAVVSVGFAVAFGLGFVHRGGAYGNVRFVNSTFFDEGFDSSVFVLELGVQNLEVVAGDGVAYVPRCVVGLDRSFGQAADADYAVTRRDVVDTGFERKAADGNAGGD